MSKLREMTPEHLNLRTFWYLAAAADFTFESDFFNPAYL